MEQNRKLISPLLIIMFTGLFFSGSILAQPPQRGRMQGPPQLPDSTQIVRMVDELATAISLSEKQKTQISDLYFAHFAEVGELSDKYKSDREGHREAMEDLREEFDEQVKSLLTEDQVDLFEDYAENRQKQRRGNRAGRR